MRFLYQGPPQAISLKTGSAKDKAGNTVSKFTDVDLVTNKECDLPEENPLVQSMLAQKILVPVQKTTPVKKGEK